MTVRTAIETSGGAGHLQVVLDRAPRSASPQLKLDRISAVKQPELGICVTPQTHS